LPVGAYPGTFDPPTVAHLAIAEVARTQGGLEKVHLILSTAPLGKGPTIPRFEHRLAVLEAIASTRPWLEVRVTEAQLIADIAPGFDAVVMGSDKWLQVIDPAWYGGSVAARDDTVSSLPLILVAVREGVPLSDPLPRHYLLLNVDQQHAGVSSSAVRGGRTEGMAAEAAQFDEATGAWSDPVRYRRSFGL